MVERVVWMAERVVQKATEGKQLTRVKGADHRVEGDLKASKGNKRRRRGRVTHQIEGPTHRVEE
jgi:hypothetical protein